MTDISAQLPPPRGSRRPEEDTPGADGGQPTNRGTRRRPHRLADWYHDVAVVREGLRTGQESLRASGAQSHLLRLNQHAQPAQVDAVALNTRLSRMLFDLAGTASTHPLMWSGQRVTRRCAWPRHRQSPR